MSTQILQHKNEAVLTSEKVVAEVRPKTTSRLMFVDNLRIFLTILVILHHLMNIYAASGGWIYQEGRQDMFTALAGKWFTVVNQAYFMGLFMLISAYFVPGSYDRKGGWLFVKDRLIRLGIPLAVYSWVIRPVLIYAGFSATGDVNISIIEWYTRQYFREYPIIGGGPLWFVSALLIFSMVYALVRSLSSARQAHPVVETPFPGNGLIGLFAGVITLASFVVRLWSPSDQVFGLLGFQFADFPQYIALFIAGLVAYRRGWLVRLPARTGKFWMWIAALMILLWPPMVILLGAFENMALFLGGWHWQSLLAATWQSFLGVSMIVSVVHLFHRYLDRQGTLARILSPNAYTAYLIHEAVITFAALLVMGVMIYPLLKFGLMAVITIPIIFGLSSLIRKLPFTDHIL